MPQMSNHDVKKNALIYMRVQSSPCIIKTSWQKTGDLFCHTPALRIEVRHIMTSSLTKNKKNDHGC